MYFWEGRQCVIRFCAVNMQLLITHCLLWKRFLVTLFCSAHVNTLWLIRPMASHMKLHLTRLAPLLQRTAIMFSDDPGKPYTRQPTAIQPPWHGHKALLRKVANRSRRWSQESLSCKKSCRQHYIICAWRDAMIRSILNYPILADFVGFL